jgi:hypothetical protein
VNALTPGDRRAQRLGGDYPATILGSSPSAGGRAGAGIVWNQDTIDALFKVGPDVVTRDSKLPLQRIPGTNKRRDLIGFLRPATGGTGDIQ